MWSRIHLVPLLLAEGDRDAYRRRQAAIARESEIMKDVKGWEVRSIFAVLDCDNMRLIPSTVLFCSALFPNPNPNPNVLLG